MRATTQFIIGTTAVKIVETDRKIRIIDIERRKKVLHFRKTICSIVLAAALTLATSFFMINIQNNKTSLDNRIYTLQTQINEIEKENTIRKKQIGQDTPDYSTIYKKAKKMGMSFPLKSHVKTYEMQTSKAVTVY